MRERARSILLVLGLLAVPAGIAGAGALLFAWSGLYDISARKGHWAITHRFLAFAMRSSVRHHAGQVDTPPLDDPAAFHLGLAHYEAGCAPCHGAPGEPPNPITQQAVPQPPYLPDHVPDWKPRELFWIVMNGLKYTSMPAWPAPERDDEVWALVSAIVRFPELTSEAYRRLLRSDTARDPATIEADARVLAAAGPVGEALVACARCHGLDGAGGGAGAFPRLTGLGERYLLESLAVYASGARPSGVMQAIAVELSGEERRILARHYAGMTAAPPDGHPDDEELRERGARIALEGVPAARVPPCTPCHGPARFPREPLAPALAGQHGSYLVRQLALWRAAIRGGGAAAEIMTTAVRNLGEDDARAVAHYYASLPPAGAAP